MSSSSPARLRQRVLALSCEDARALRADFRQLRATDLRALALAPAEAPPPRINELLASTRCLLLEPSCEPLALTAPPWPLLRLELLGDAPHVLQRMHKRLRALRAGESDGKRRRRRAESVSHAQLHFVYRTLASLVFEGEADGSDGGGSDARGLLKGFARESSIGAHLAAWVFSCLYHGNKRERGGGGDQVVVVVRGSRDAGRDERASDATEDEVDSDGSDERRRAADGHCSPTKLPRLQGRTLAARHYAETDSSAHKSGGDRHIRGGVKIGGRFYLFQAAVGDDVAPTNSALLLEQLPQQHKELYATSSAAYAVLRIETRRKAAEVVRRLEASSGCRELPGSLEAKTAAALDGFWNPRRRLPTRLARVVCYNRLYEQLSSLALTTTLFQLALHAQAFEKWNGSTPFGGAAPLLEVPMLLKFACVQVAMESGYKHGDRLVLAGIGSTTIHSHQTVADLRAVVQRAVDAKRMRSASHSTRSSFQFLHRDSLVPKLLEASLSVVVLMPFALVCEAPASPSCSASEHVRSSVFRACAAHLQQLHFAIATALRNAGPPNHLLVHPELARDPALVEPVAMETAASYFEMQQALDNEDVSAASAVVAEFFVNWRAFTHFQQLQDSTMVLEQHSSMRDELQQRKKLKKLVKSEAQRIAEFQIETENHRRQLRQPNQSRVLPSRVGASASHVSRAGLSGVTDK